jgi:hypothetical protein
MILIKILPNIYEIIGLIQAIDVDHLHSQLLHDVVLGLGVQSHSLANGQVVGDAALELVIHHEVDVEIKFHAIVIGRLHLSCLVGGGRDPGEDDGQIAVG